MPKKIGKMKLPASANTPEKRKAINQRYRNAYIQRLKKK